MYASTVVEGTTVRIAPVGPIDYDTLPALREAVRSLPPDVDTVIWDLRSATFMDVAGLHLLFGRAPEDGPFHRTVGVERLRPQHRRLLLLAARVLPGLDVAGIIRDGSLERAA
ncbi:STAS domain-containing protein [Streptomyces griseoaurantiacus]|uniref:STAS domain-containing protein n=1 Tax=Streptomyces griseoaurantiacus TaxID=68213 RepID=UPI002E2D94CB|nr:STAS domain-containing protein [Streptomyces jietaisiensis]